MDPATFNEFVRQRRSTFPDQFAKNDPIDDAIIREILTNATHAPNHGKEEPWYFTVFSGEGLHKLATLQSEFYKNNAGENFKTKTYEKLQKNPLKASHIIAIGMKRTVHKNIPEVEDIAAVACAVENIYLSLQAYGLGGYWTTGGITYMDNAKTLFQLHEPDRLMGFFYIGKIALPGKPTPRQTIEEKTTWIQ